MERGSMGEAKAELLAGGEEVVPLRNHDRQPFQS
jgi:hypothetical protein